MNVAIESRQSLVDRIGQLAPELRALGVARLSVFGSFARNAARDDSDIDLLVEFLPGRKTFDNFSSVYDLLEDALQRRIELLTRESLSPYIGPRILKEAMDVFAAN
jgi:uncharacterized protein